MALTPEQVASFRADGFLFPVRTCDQRTADANRAAFDALEAAAGRNNHFGIGQPLHLSEEWAWRLASSPQIVESVQQLFGSGSSVFCIASHVFVKYGTDEEEDGQTLGPGAFVGFHQDLNFWGLEPGHVISAWTAIDDADVGNGCMQAVRGSYKRPRLQHQKLGQWNGHVETLVPRDVNKEPQTGGRGVNMLSQEQHIVLSAEDEARLVDLEVQAGESVLFHGWTCHGSPPNRSNRRASLQRL